MFTTEVLQKKRWHKAGLDFVLFIILLAVTLLNFAPVGAKSAGSELVIAWNAITQETLTASEKTSPVQTMIYQSYVHGAIYDAVANIEEGYNPYNMQTTKHPNASVDVAVSTAAYKVLVHYFPEQKDKLDTHYASAMAAVPNGRAKNEGILVGKLAARGMIDLRANDGLEADIGFTMPQPATGAWELPQEQSPHTPWASQLKPFLIESPDQFRPAAPPDLGSSKWVKAYNEVKEVGSANSAVRTDEQAEVAKFWTTQPGIQYNTAFADISQKHQFDVLETARLFAMGNMIGSDALIACFDAKYEYLFWRPMFAVPRGDSDDSPDTVGDSTWAPLIGTPTHPEFPSAHGCLTTAMAEVFSEALGTRKIAVDLRSKLPDQPETMRHYATAGVLIKEISDARVWGGIHYRFSMEQGSRVGFSVARYALARDFLPPGEEPVRIP